MAFSKVRAGDPVWASLLLFPDPNIEPVLAGRLQLLGGCYGLAEVRGTLLNPRVRSPGTREGLHSPNRYTVSKEVMLNSPL